MGGYYQVTADRAHVWVEAYLEGSGWHRIDPTSFAVNAGEVWGSKSSRSLLFKLRLAIDSIDHAWNRSVVSYDFEQQIRFAQNAGQKLQQINPLRTMRRLLPYLALFSVCCAMLIIFRTTVWFRPREERILRRFLKRVAAEYGMHVDLPGLGLIEIAKAVDITQVHEFTSIYATALYHDRRLSNADYARLIELLDMSWESPLQ